MFQNQFSQPYPQQYMPQYGITPQERMAQMEQQYAQQKFNQIPMYGQQFQQNQTPQIPPLQGRVVSDFDTMKALEIPLDGSVSYFPMANREYVFAKSLNLNTGNTDIDIYQKIVQQNAKPTQETQSNIDELKAYFDQKFEALKKELKGNVGNGRKPNNKSVDEPGT